MGLPINNNNQSPSAQPQITDPMQAAPQTAPRSAAELPAAALDLASKLFDLARAGDTTTLASYLTAGIPPNLTNHEGNTLLMLASYSGHAETTQMLLDKGADPNEVNGKGQSPLAGAMFKGWDEVVSVLDKGGAERRAGHPNAEDCAIMFKRERWISEWEISSETAGPQS